LPLSFGSIGRIVEIGAVDYASVKLLLYAAMLLGRSPQIRSSGERPAHQMGRYAGISNVEVSHQRAKTSQLLWRIAASYNALVKQVCLMTRCQFWRSFLLGGKL
jgi:hypothetical protein